MPIDLIELAAKACVNMTNDEIYEFFEFVVADSLRDEILDKYSDETSPEPCRQAMIALGEKYNIQSLIDY